VKPHHLPALAVLWGLLASVLTAACAQPAAPAAYPAAEAAPSPAAPARAPVTPSPAPQVRYAARIAYPSPSLSYFPIYVGWREGLFAEEGVDLEWIGLQSNLMISALVSGEVDYGTSFSSIVRAAATGVDVRAILATVDRPQHTFVVSPEIVSGEQLRGKRIAINSLGGAQEYEAYQVLARYGLGRADATLTGIPSEATRLQALIAGAVDAAVMNSPYDLQAEDNGFRVLVRLADIIELTHAGVGTSTAKLRAAPDEVKRFLKASLRSVELSKRNKALVVGYIQDWMEMPSDLANRAYDVALPTWSSTGVAPEAGLQLDLAEVKAQTGSSDDIPISRVVDYTLLREASRELGRPLP
jgi:NitT/TauT family transport system substrate-binding protein